MSYTEDDTFERLKREPFREVFIKCVRVGISLGDMIIDKHADIILSSGWATIEFEARLEQAIKTENLRMDIIIVNDPIWQEEFLACKV